VLLGLRGHEFELGTGLSEATARACEAAWPRLLQLCTGT
jgi:hypothetical protein